MADAAHWDLTRFTWHVRAMPSKTLGVPLTQVLPPGL